MKENNTKVMYTDSGIPIKTGKKLGIGYIIAALFFLFNPDITVIDILPDAIGYTLLTVGLSKLSFVNDALEYSATRFKKMILVSCLKFAAILLIFGLFDLRERPYAFLLFSFSFMVIDLIFVIPAFKSMFEGFIYLAGRHKSEVSYRRRPMKNILENKDVDSLDPQVKEKLLKRQERISQRYERKKTYIEKIYAITIVFVILKAVGYALPEFIALTKDSYTDNSFVMYMYNFISHFRVLAFLTVLVFGLIWLVRTAIFFIRLGGEKDYISRLRQAFEEKAIKREGVFIKRSIKNSLLLIGLAAIFGIDFHVSITLDIISSQYISVNKVIMNVFPDIISAAFFIMAAYIMRRYLKSYKTMMATSGIYFIASGICTALNMAYFFKFGTYSAVNHLNEAYYMFYGVCILGIIEGLAFLATIIAFVIFMKELIGAHAGYVSERKDSSTQGWINVIQRELFLKILVVLGFAVLSAISASVYRFMLIERHFFAQLFWVIDFVIQTGFAVSVISAMLGVGDEVNNRYMLS